MSRAHGMLRSFGPECQKCGCPMNLIEAGMNGAWPYAIFRCEFCNHQQSMGRVRAASLSSDAPVVYKTIRCKCPECGAKNPPVVSPRGPVRWHKCDKCGHSFKSVEEEQL